MPIVYIVGAPTYLTEEKFAEIEEAIKKTVASIKELGLKEDMVSVYFLENMRRNRPRLEIIATIDGLLDKPERTDEVRDKLAKKVRDVIQYHIVDAKLIECMVKPFDLAQGFASYQK